MLKRHVKLVEALGAIIVLTAWGLDWWSVQAWTNARKVFDRSISSIQHADATTQILIRISREAAINRSVRNYPPAKNSPEKIIQEAWESVLVKNVWLHEILWGITALDEFALAVRTAYSENQLPLTDHQERILLDIKKFEGNFFKHFDIAKGHRGNLLQYANRPIDPSDANDVSTELQNLQWKVSALVNDSIKILAEKYKRQSVMYRIAYAFGGLLFVFAKLLEWRRELFNKGGVAVTHTQISAVAQPSNLALSADRKKKRGR